MNPTYYISIGLGTFLIFNYIKNKTRIIQYLDDLIYKIENKIYYQEKQIEMTKLDEYDSEDCIDLTLTSIEEEGEPEINEDDDLYEYIRVTN